MGNSDALQALSILTSGLSKVHELNIVAQQNRIAKEQYDEEARFRKAEYENSLVARYGQENIDYSGNLPKVKSEGFNVEFTPEWKIFKMQEDIKNMSAGKLLERELLIKEFYNKEDERDKLVAEMAGKYKSLNMADISSGFKNVANTFEGVAEGNLENIQNTIKSLGSDISGLHKLSQDLKSQEIWYDENLQKYVGRNLMIDEPEFDQMVNDYTKGDGSINIAGLKNAYLANKPTPIEHANQVATLDKFNMDSAVVDYEGLRTTILTDDYDFSLITNDEKVQQGIQVALGFSNVKDFADWMQSGTDISNAALKAIQGAYPAAMSNIINSANESNEMFREVYNFESNQNLNSFNSDFKSKIKGLSKNEAFSIFKESTTGIGLNKDEQQVVFKSLEDNFGGKDLGSEYMDWLTKGSKAETNFRDEIQKVKDQESLNLNTLNNYIESAKIFKRWGASPSPKFPELLQLFREETGNNPALMNLYNPVERGGFVIPPDLSQDQMKLLRDVILNKAKEWADAPPVGWLKSTFTNAADRDDAINLLDDWEKFEKAYLDYKNIESIDMSPALKAIDKLSNQYNIKENNTNLSDVDKAIQKLAQDPDFLNMNPDLRYAMTLLEAEKQKIEER
tara:strand:- start:14447 stop:16315 length:1869 start_codon:yes stop_codon:yes gene_type:complete